MIYDIRGREKTEDRARGGIREDEKNSPEGRDDRHSCRFSLQGYTSSVDVQRSLVLAGFHPPPDDEKLSGQ